MPRFRAVLVLGSLGTVPALACAADAQQRWTGTMETLPSGQVVVRNPADPIWRAGEEWRVAEEVRIGSVEGGGPAAFGRIEAFEVDRAGRIWVVDGHARQVIVFDRAGSHVRTIGRRGGGPGEFEHPVAVDLAPDGNIWVVDVVNDRISAFDTAGRYVDARRIPTRFKISPWWGGFDDAGRFYAPVAAAPAEWEQFAITLVRHDSALVPRDTLERPRHPVRRDVVEVRGVKAQVPLQGGLVWQLSRAGTVWALVTDEYRLFELGWAGDTLRTITRAFSPLPVTDADRMHLRREWAAVTEPDALPAWWSRLPRTKPPVTGLFFLDEERNIWVERQPETLADRERTFDVFDREGRWLGPVRVPFAFRGRPIARGGYLYGITLDELDVQYLVKVRVIRARG